MADVDVGIESPLDLVMRSSDSEEGSSSSPVLNQSFSRSESEMYEPENALDLVMRSSDNEEPVSDQSFNGYEAEMYEEILAGDQGTSVSKPVEIVVEAKTTKPKRSRAKPKKTPAPKSPNPSSEVPPAIPKKRTRARKPVAPETTATAATTTIAPVTDGINKEIVVTAPTEPSRKRSRKALNPKISPTAQKKKSKLISCQSSVEDDVKKQTLLMSPSTSDAAELLKSNEPEELDKAVNNDMEPILPQKIENTNLETTDCGERPSLDSCFNYELESEEVTELDMDMVDADDDVPEDGETTENPPAKPATRKRKKKKGRNGNLYIGVMNRPLWLELQKLYGFQQTNSFASFVLEYMKKVYRDFSIRSRLSVASGRFEGLVGHVWANGVPRGVDGNGNIMDLTSMEFEELSTEERSNLLQLAEDLYKELEESEASNDNIDEADAEGEAGEGGEEGEDEDDDDENDCDDDD